MGRRRYFRCHIVLYYDLVYMTIVFESSYCNVYGTEYQLRYVYRNNGSGIAVEYITGTSNLLCKFEVVTPSPRTTGVDGVGATGAVGYGGQETSPESTPTQTKTAHVNVHKGSEIRVIRTIKNHRAARNHNIADE
jgi:hypothetical protein